MTGEAQKELIAQKQVLIDRFNELLGLNQTDCHDTARRSFTYYWDR